MLSSLRLLLSLWDLSSTTSLMFDLCYTWSLLQHSFFYNFTISLNVFFHYFFGVQSYDQLKLFDNTLWAFWCRLTMLSWCPSYGHLSLLTTSFWVLKYCLTLPLWCSSFESLRLLTTSYEYLGIILLYLFGVWGYGHLRFFDDISSLRLASRNVISFLQCWSLLGHLVALLPHFKL